MITRYTYDSETWVDVDHGTPEEIGELMDTYKIHPFIAKELTSATRKARIEYRDTYVYCILHFPAFKHTHGTDENQEVDFIIGKNLLITARYDTIDAFHKYGKTLEVKEVLENNLNDKRTCAIFIDLLRELYSAMFEEFEYIEDMTEEITSRIFAGKEREMVVSISEVTRTLLDFKKVTDLHFEILESLHHNGREMFGDRFCEDMESIIVDYRKISTTIRSNLEMLRELRDTNNSLLTAKQNETIKQLTVVGSIILPLNLIAVIFGIRAHDLPIVNGPHASLIILGIMIASVAITLSFIRHKKWL
ncbi:MAG: CorA family divalent cation transporter [Patescibacteria group bacterium]